MIKNLSKNRFVRFFTSYYLTTACIGLLIVLTAMGTIYQLDHGLYAAKQRFFNSWVFILAGFLPFPGGRLVMWLSFFNLLAVTVFRFKYRWFQVGMLLTHLGLILLLAGSGVTFHFSRESFITLGENEGTNVSTSYHNWEIAAWTQEQRGDTTLKRIESFSLEGLNTGSEIKFNENNLYLKINQFHPNCTPYQDQKPQKIFRNSTGITHLKASPKNSDPEKNFPGLIFSLSSDSPTEDTNYKVLLFSGDPYPTPVYFPGKTMYFSLRRKAYLLPLTIKLLDFEKTEHPGTNMPRSFESRVDIKTPEFSRETVISMNKPFRYQNYTFYQSSYSQNEGGEFSTLAVVYNPGRLLPYISSLLISLTLMLHFCQKLISYSLKKKINFSKLND